MKQGVEPLFGGVHEAEKDPKEHRLCDLRHIIEGDSELVLSWRCGNRMYVWTYLLLRVAEATFN